MKDMRRLARKGIRGNGKGMVAQASLGYSFKRQV